MGGVYAARGTPSHRGYNSGMNVFGVGPLEMLVVLVVALVFVGPERLPRLAADIARTIREIRKYTNSLASEFNDVISDLEKETASERSEWKDIGRGLSDATKSVTDTIHQARLDATQPEAARPEAPPAGETPPNGHAASSNGASDAAPAEATPVADAPTAEPREEAP